MTSDDRLLSRSSLYCSTLIREASFYIISRSTQKHTTCQCARESKTLECSALNGTQLSLKIRDLWGREGIKSIRTRSGKWFQINSFYQTKQNGCSHELIGTENRHKACSRSSKAKSQYGTGQVGVKSRSQPRSHWHHYLFKTQSNFL